MFLCFSRTWMLLAPLVVGVLVVVGSAAGAQEQVDAGKGQASQIEIYDIDARYRDVPLFRKIAGLTFKLRNNSGRTVTKLDVTAFFADADGYVIHEELFSPIGGDGLSSQEDLKPNYIWQPGLGRVLPALSVPSEWQEGSVAVKVAAIEFDSGTAAGKRVKLADTGGTMPKQIDSRAPVMSAEMPLPRRRPPGLLRPASAVGKPSRTPATEAVALNLDRLSALLDKRLDANPNGVPRISDSNIHQPGEAALASQPLSSSELAAIRAQFERCWSPPTGARNARNLVVVVRVQLKADGSLLGRPEVTNRGDPDDRFWKVAAESALRAVRKCEPVLGLDPSQYERWREFKLTFNPRDMRG